MTDHYRPIADLLDRVRARWRRVTVFRALTRSSVAAMVPLVLFVLLVPLTVGRPGGLAVTGVVAFLAALALFAWGLRPLTQRPSDLRIARFIEERRSELEERLVSAVGLEGANRTAERSRLAASMVGDAARAAATIDPAEIVASGILRRAGAQMGVAVVALLAVLLAARTPARQAYDALSLLLFPATLTLEVWPGDARVQAGSAFTVEAQLVGNTAPVLAELLRAEGDSDDWQRLPMATAQTGRFVVSMSGLASSFRYRVAAGPAASKTYAVSVVRAPRVARIDVEYTYPKALGLPRRMETDGGDIYAPEGTDVRVNVRSDGPAASGRLVLDNGRSIPLDPAVGGYLAGSLRIVEDGSYRVALSDATGLSSRGDTEYFIRRLDDRPPEVRIVKPASDRRVTALEEVNIEAEADDDFGVSSLEIVYAVRGGPERVVPLGIPARSTTVTGRHTMYLEDLGVRPGDFVSYYIRARDLARGKRSSEARSDLFFLDIKPFAEEFTLAQTQAVMGGGQSNQQVDDLVAAQKQIIVSTWKLDRRSEASQGAKSSDDIRLVARAEGELKTRVEQASSAFRQGAMRDPRGRSSGRGRPTPPSGPRAGQSLAEEDAMKGAADAMGQAVDALNALKTGRAIPPELDALKHLLKAQADVNAREIQRQASGNGGGNRSSQDMSSLFDKELARHQQTNYETPQSANSGTSSDHAQSALEKIKDLAQRQDEQLRRQQELARAKLPADELARRLDSLTREQNQLRQQAEELAKSMAGRAEQERQSGQASQGGQAGRARQAGRGMREASEAMRDAASDLRRQDAGQASTSAARALDRLRDLAKQLEAQTPDGRRRALGDLQLEARQLADAERRIAAESGRARKSQAGEQGKDSLRRLAGEQERLADRVERVQQALAGQGLAGGRGAQASEVADANGTAGNTRPQTRDEGQRLQRAAASAAREMGRQRLSERMRESAASMREGAAQQGSAPSVSAEGMSPAQEEVAQALDSLADQLASAGRAGDPGDAATERLSERLARSRKQRERLEAVGRRLDQLGQQAEQDGQARPGQGSEVAQLQEQWNREMREARALLDQLQREGTTPRQGAGSTFAGQGMVLSAPGTEAFKQDYSQWQEMKRQVAASLERAESSIAQKLNDRAAKDRLAAGFDDKVPTIYQDRVDSYFKALATRKPH